MSSRLYDKNAVSDLVLLEDIGEDAVCKTLEARLRQQNIYTNIGAVLISVNPFREIRDLYSASRIAQYQGRHAFELPPHVYALAETAYRALISDRKDQCIVISGESGAGKTEASKKILQYISAVSDGGAEIERVKDQLLKSNPVLEAFGNAKTVRNNNSSRFGKYMEIVFDYAGRPLGATVSSYLLEKIRVIQPAADERNFHIFYQVAAGLSDAERKSLSILPAEQYNYLKRSGCYKVKGMDDRAEFDMTVEGLAALGLSDKEIAELFRVVSAVLWIGQVEFTGADKAAVQDEGPIKIVAGLLGCPPDQLRAALLNRTIQDAGRPQAAGIKKPLDVEAARYTRDALAKNLYSKMFDWVVGRINGALATSNIDGVDEKSCTSIGVLDIYGFEIFGTNSFEQFCINFCNEKLQQLFIELTLRAEQDEYKREGIEWEPVKFFNNKIVCDLIEKQPRCIMGFLDEDCLLGRGTDQTFLEKLKKQFAAHAHFAAPASVKDQRNQFTIKHYAGDVTYAVDGFLDKNRDLVWRDLLLVGEGSSLAVMKGMYPAGTANAMGKRRPVTAGTNFVRQMNALMDTLNKCVPHYVRCIKPNETKSGLKFEEALVRHQIRYLGLVENVRVRRAGFAFRQTFTHFLQRYKCLTAETWPFWEGGPEKAGVDHILRTMGQQAGSQYQLGVSKIFIRNPVSLFSLEELRERKLHDLATMIQKVFRSWRARKYFLELREKALGLFGRNKLRRRVSVRRFYTGDYVGAAQSVAVQKILSKYGDRRVLFCDTAEKINRKYRSQRRVLLLTDVAMYNLAPGNFSVKRRIDITKVSAVSLSKKADNFFVVHVDKEYDYLYDCERKTEVLTALSDQFRLLTERELPFNFQDSFIYHESKGLLSQSRDKKPRTITFVDDGSFEGTRFAPDPKNKSTHLIVSVGKIDTVNERFLASVAPKHMTKGAPKPKKRFGHGRGISVGDGSRFAVRVPEASSMSSIEEKKGAFSGGGGGGGGGGAAAAPAPAASYKRNLSPPGAGGETWVVALHDFKGQDAQELSFEKGAYLRIHAKEADGWWKGEDEQGRLGYIPKTYVEEVKKPGRARGSSRANVPLPRP